MLRAGLAIADMTPPVGTRLSGFAGRPTINFASTGVRDPLRATVLWLEDGSNNALVIALDTIGLSVGEDLKWRLRLAETLGCPPSGILIACSHTHSGACTMDIRATGEKETQWTRSVFDRVLDAAHQAKASAVPVTRATTGNSPCDAAINRRRAEGPRDPLARTLSLHTETGPLVTLFHFACHPVALGNQNTEISADWVATARARAEATLGCPTLFLQGCCGDINPRFRAGPRSPEQAERVGIEIAEAVLAAESRANPILLTPIRSGRAGASLPLLPYPSDDILSQVEADARAKLTQLGRSDVDQAYLEWVAAVRRVPARTGISATVSALLLGDITLVGLPGEIFAELGLALEGTWPVGYANGNLGYLYPDSAMAVGGYEVDVAYRLYGKQPLAPGAAEALLGAARRALEHAQSM